MSLDAQRIIDVIRQAVRQMTRNGAMRDHMIGWASTGGAYQVSAYLGGADTLSDYIEVPAGMFVPSGAYIEVVRSDEEQEVRRVLPSLFARLAFDFINGRIKVGSGSAEPSDDGSSGYILRSGGSSGSAYWSSETHESAHINHDTTWTAKGDLIVGTGDDAASVLSVGANGRMLVADSGQSVGMRWTQVERKRGTGSSIAAGANDSITVTWDNAFSDTDYTVVVSLEGVSAIRLLTCGVVSKSTTGFTLSIQNNSGSTAVTPSYNAIAIHD